MVSVSFYLPVFLLHFFPPYFLSSSLPLASSPTFFLYLLKIQIMCEFVYIRKLHMLILHTFICFFVSFSAILLAMWFFSLPLINTWKTESTNSFCQSLPFSTCLTVQFINTGRILQRLLLKIGSW